MKTRLLLATAMFLLAGNAFAQKNTKSAITSKSNVETIVINGGDKPETVIEIKDGYLYINSEEVTDIKSTTANKKIVVENSTTDRSSFPWLRDMENKFPRKAMLGVYTGNSDNNIGTVIQEVIPGSAADKAGLKEGDIITAVNDSLVNSPEDLVNAIKNRQPGETVKIAYTRNNDNKTSSVVLSRSTPADFFRSYKYNTPDMPEINIPNPFRNFGDNFEELRSPRPKLGMQIENADNGVKVIEINKNSPAWNAGLQKGDIIYSFNGKDVKNVDDLQQAVRNSETGKKLLVVFDRDGKDLETDVVLSDNRPKSRM